MEVHQLRYFLAVAETGSFSRAAERSHVAQPSLSQQIQKLERELGQPLFDRLSRKVTLTEAGVGLLPYARRILNDIADAQKFAANGRGEPSGLVRVGMIPTIAPYVVGRFLEACGRELPRVEAAVTEDVTERLVRAVDEGEIDLAIISTCRPAATLHVEECGREPLLVALPKGHALAGEAEVGWMKLRKEKILLLHESHCLSRQIRNWCAGRGLRASDDANVLQLRTLLALIASGRGISFVPEMATEIETEQGCVLVKIKGRAPGREINVLRNQSRHQTRAAAAVAELARGLLCKPGGG